MTSREGDEFEEKTGCGNKGESEDKYGSGNSEIGSLRQEVHATW